MSNTSDKEPLDRTFGWISLSAHRKEGPQCITVKGRKVRKIERKGGKNRNKREGRKKTENEMRGR